MAEDKDSGDNISLHRALSHLKRGGLHKALGVDPNSDIPKDKVEAATHSKNSHIAHMARFSQTLSHFKH